MRIHELITEYSVGTVSPVEPTTSPTPAVQPPKSNTSTAPNAAPDPASNQLSQLLKQNQINVNTSDDFLKAFTAIQQKQQLTPDQEKVMGDYAKATIAKPGLPTQMAGLMKTIMSKKPAAPAAAPAPQAMGATPPAGI